MPIYLSVSSVGSEAMQLTCVDELMLGRYWSFSILGRIGGDATNLLVPPCTSWFHFQYPRSDRRRCNSLRDGGVLQTALIFQYPRSDRRRCNKQKLLGQIAEYELSVSSVGSEAMQPFLRVFDRWLEGYFQYPRSDRRRCNCGCAGLGGVPVGLSVSSVGSEGMQRAPTVQPHLQNRPFSILGRIGGDATKRASWRRVGRRVFQYPRSDRRRCNEGRRR